MMERILCLLIGYVCGLFQTGYFVGKMKNTDIRQYGSGNLGTTNALRILGRRAGALTLVGDFLKCMLAMYLASLAFRNSCGEYLPLLTLYAAAGCILGHNFPFYLHFKGGKGVAALVGLAWFFDWRILAIGVVIFFTIFFVTHYVSLGSLTIYPLCVVAMMFFGQRGDYHMEQRYLTELYVLMAALAALAWYRHRGNIKRLLSGTESKVYLSKKNK